jgi:hypothetical protein
MTAIRLAGGMSSLAETLAILTPTRSPASTRGAARCLATEAATEAFA